MGAGNDGPWNYGGPMNGGSGFNSNGPGYGPGSMPYGAHPGYAEYGYGQHPAYGYGAPEFNNNGYYGQPYAGFGGPAHWGNNPGNGWNGTSGNRGGSVAPGGWGNGSEGVNYGPNNDRSNGNGWGFQYGWR